MSEAAAPVALTTRCRLEKEAEELLRSEGINPAAAIVASKNGTHGVGEYEVLTNVHGIKWQKPIVIYRYDVSIIGTIRTKNGTDKIIDLTKRYSSDAVAIDYRERCREVFFVFVKENKAFVKNVASVYYDLQSIMYSLNELEIPSDGSKTFTIPTDKLSQSMSFFTSCSLKIRRVASNGVFDLENAKKFATDDLDAMDYSMLQFLDVATSQHVLFQPNKYVSLSATKNFLLDPGEYEFTADDTAFFPDNGSYLAIGAQKSVRPMEGPNKKGSIALIIEAKKTPFHSIEPLLEKVRRLIPNLNNMHDGDRAKLEKFCFGLCVETRHLNRSQRFYIRGVDSESAASRMITVDGRNLSIQNYFLERYQLQLAEPNIPLLRMRSSGQDSYIPIELCYVIDNQRVKTNQQTSKQVQDTIKKCAVAPAVLFRQNEQIFRAMEFNSSPYLQNAGITILENPVTVRGALIPPPEIEFSSRSIASVNLKSFTWQNRAFLIPQTCSRWVAYAFLGIRDRLSNEEFQKFLERYITEAKTRGIRIFDPIDAQLVPTCDVKVVGNYINEASKNTCTFALVIHPDGGDELHSSLKLNERQFNIVTQAVCLSTLTNVVRAGQPQTMSNLVNKTNIKLGGLNYTLTISSPGARDVLNGNILFIGFGMNHPGGGLDGWRSEEQAVRADGRKPPPSVVGYCANVGLMDNFEFIGDFYYQSPLRDEKMDVIRTIVQRCLDMYRTNRRAEPKHIVLYRNGCSEGNFSMILRLEVPLIKSMLEKMKCEAKLVVLVPNKMQNIRFIPKNVNEHERASDQNVKPGFYIDHSIAHPVLNEFYLNSHRALQGTARTPKYTVLINESEFSLEAIEKFTYALCYGHQIVMMPTSLPSPVYIALRYAERGRKLYNIWLAESESDHAKLSYEEATERLSYFHIKDLANRRVNA